MHLQRRIEQLEARQQELTPTEGAVHYAKEKLLRALERLSGQYEAMTPEETQVWAKGLRLEMEAEQDPLRRSIMQQMLEVCCER